MAMRLDEYDPRNVSFGDVRYSNAEIDMNRVTYGQLCEKADSVLRNAALLHVSAMQSSTYPNKGVLAMDIAYTVQACADLAAANGIFDVSNYMEMIINNKLEQGKMSDDLTEHQKKFIESLKKHERKHERKLKRQRKQKL